MEILGSVLLVISLTGATLNAHWGYWEWIPLNIFGMFWGIFLMAGKIR